MGLGRVEDADQVFAVRQVCETYLAKWKNVFWAFMDLERHMINMIGMVCGKLMKTVLSFYSHSRVCVSEWEMM